MPEDALENKKIGSLKSLIKVINYQWVLQNTSFFLFVAFLIIIYIANGHRADKMIRDSNATAGEIKELQYEYKTVKSELMSRSREAEVIKVVSKEGLKVNANPPVRIKLLHKENKQKD